MWGFVVWSGNFGWAEGGPEGLGRDLALCVGKSRVDHPSTYRNVIFIQAIIPTIPKYLEALMVKEQMVEVRHGIYGGWRLYHSIYVYIA